MKGHFLCILFFTILVVPACNGKNMEYYKPNAIVIDSVDPQGTNSVKIRYYVMSETLYYCPGVNVQKKDDSVTVMFARCSISEKCEVTHPAQSNTEGDFVVISNVEKPIYIASDKDRKVIYPETAK